jgi:hypothetical protein
MGTYLPSAFREISAASRLFKIRVLIKSCQHCAEPAYLNDDHTSMRSRRGPKRVILREEASRESIRPHVGANGPRECAPDEMLLEAIEMINIAGHWIASLSCS